MKKRIALAVLGVLVVVGVLGGLKALQITDLIAAGDAQQMPPTAITSATARNAEWEVTLEGIGTMEAARGVTVTADLPGRVTALYFDGGETVEAGEVLLEQDTSTEDAQLRAAESSLALARSSLDRVERLSRSNAVSQSELDSASATFENAQAQVDDIRTSIDKKRIVAPFAGRLGLRQVDIGQDLGQGVPIVSLQDSDPMRVNVSLPQQVLGRVAEGQPVRVTTDAVPGRTFDGRITAIDTEIDPSTRTVRVQAELENPAIAADGDGGKPALLPGMFASVEVVLPENKPVLMVPLTAVSFATFGDSVFVLEESDGANVERGGAPAGQLAARQQFVQLGERRGDFVEVLKGLEPGQTVAGDGVFKLRNGAAVVVNDDGAQEPSLNPTPDNA